MNREEKKIELGSKKSLLREREKEIRTHQEVYIFTIVNSLSLLPYMNV